MADRLLTPSKITAWLDCAHYLTLKHEVDAGARPKPPKVFGEMAEMLKQKGLDHEQAVLAKYRADGREVFEVPDWDRGNESFAAWVARVGDVLAEGHDVDLPDAVRARRRAGDRRLPRAGRSARRHLRLRAGRRQARPQRGQARPRAAAVLLRRGDRRADGSLARAPPHRPRLRPARDRPRRRRHRLLASPAQPACVTGRRPAE